MANLKLKNPSGGSLNLVSADGASDLTVTFPAGTGTAVVNGVSSSIVSGTAVASTSGTSITFTGIPSWAKRITLMFDNISTNGGTSAVFLVQIGNTTFTTTGYSGSFAYTGIATGGAASTVGFPMMAQNTADIHSGQATINLLSGSSYKYTFSSTLARTDGIVCFGGSVVTLGALLDRVRVTTTNGTDVFDQGTINILYE